MPVVPDEAADAGCKSERGEGGASCDGLVRREAGRELGRDVGRWYVGYTSCLYSSSSSSLLSSSLSRTASSSRRMEPSTWRPRVDDDRAPLARPVEPAWE